MSLRFFIDLKREQINLFVNYKNVHPIKIWKYRWGGSFVQIYIEKVKNDNSAVHITIISKKNVNHKTDNNV